MSRVTASRWPYRGWYTGKVREGGFAEVRGRSPEGFYGVHSTIGQRTAWLIAALWLVFHPKLWRA